MTETYKIHYQLGGANLSEIPTTRGFRKSNIRIRDKVIEFINAINDFLNKNPDKKPIYNNIYQRGIRYPELLNKNYIKRVLNNPTNVPSDKIGRAHV